MRDSFLPFSPPALSDAERDEVLDALRSDWISKGPKTQRFERELQQYLGAPALVALNSCTAGLHVALMALGIRPGDEVIVPAMTFCATANVVEHVGARPVIVDVSPDTLNIDPERIAAALSPRTRAILPVHYAGHPADLDPIFAMAQARCIHVIEDAAHAIPATYRGTRVGSRGNFASFSFYATKNLTTGEGGALTGAPALVDKARILGHHGMDRDAWKRFDKSGSTFYEVVLPGFKYNMTDINASLGLAQLKRVNGFQRRRREIVAAYREALAPLPEIELPVERSDVESSWHLYVIRLRLERLNIDRDEFAARMKAQNIGTSVHYVPVHMHPFYRNKYGLKPQDCPVALDAFQRMISLPLHPNLSDEDVADVTQVVRRLVENHACGVARAAIA
jgi:dTDP-4-amino-4,6-dideoxygalactose transaminase